MISMTIPGDPKIKVAKIVLLISRIDPELNQ